MARPATPKKEAGGKKAANPYGLLLSPARPKAPLALATIVAAQGSAPQVVGASALFSRRGLVRGTLGGGLLEALSGKAAAAALRAGRSRFLDLGLSGELDSTDEAVCGGRVKILIDAAPDKHAGVFRRMEASLAAGRAGVLATLIRDRGGRGGLSLSRHWIPGGESAARTRRGPLLPFRTAIRDRFRRPGPLGEKGKAGLYAELREPPPRLIIAGAGHIGRAVCGLGSWLGFEVTVVDDRPEFARRRRLPEADRIIVGDIGPTLARLPFGRAAYVVIVTRGHSQDAAALRSCLGRRAAYVGLIGSRRKIALMRENFLKQGWASEEDLRRLSAPIGLDIRSQTVEEIAVSIAAELVLRRRTLSGPDPGRGPWFGP
jgi:xanthine dehydrogenase accessory factor